MKAPSPGTGDGVRIAGDDAGRFRQLRHRRADAVELGAAGEGAHLRRLLARIADADPGEALGKRVLHRVEMRGRRHGTADGGAFLARLGGHLARDLLDEQIEFGRAGRGVRAEDRGVEAVPLGDEAHRIRGRSPGATAASSRSRPSR